MEREIECEMGIHKSDLWASLVVEGWDFTFCTEMLFTKGYFISLWVFGLG